MTRHHRIAALVLLFILSLSVLCLPGCGANSYTKDEVQYDSSYEVESQNKAASTAEPARDKDGSYDRKIIQTAHLVMQVKDVTAAADQIIDLNTSKGGYTVSSHTYRHEERVSAELVLRVPQPDLNDFLATVSSYGEVKDKTISTEDVTQEYYDSEARLTVLKAKEERLLNLLNQANNITDIISIENELGETRSEIEVLTGRLKYLTNATDYSQVNINLMQAVPGAVKAPQGTLGKSIQGLVNSLNQLINFASDLVVLVFVLLPWLVILALIYFLVRYIRKRRKSRVPKE
jgi:hypothetical protein